LANEITGGEVLTPNSLTFFNPFQRWELGENITGIPLSHVFISNPIIEAMRKHSTEP
jgi:hypothetical protein